MLSSRITQHLPGKRFLSICLESVREPDLQEPFRRPWAGQVTFWFEAEEDGERLLWLSVDSYSGFVSEAATVSDSRVAHRVAMVVTAGLQELNAATSPPWNVLFHARDALRLSGISLTEARHAGKQNEERFWSLDFPREEHLPYHLLWLERGQLHTRSAQTETGTLSAWTPVAGELVGARPIETLDQWVALDPGTPRPQDDTLAEALWTILRRPVPRSSGRVR